MCFNYRHYCPSSGRWLSREKVPILANNSYAFLGNVANSTDMLGLYDVLVHYYLMYALMRELGYTDTEAQEIAAGSQYPDTREWDAMHGGLSPTQAQAQMRELFHNLNSLDCCGRSSFRNCLLKAMGEAPNLFYRGVYLHTLADIYAHVDPRTDCSYGSQKGHFWDGFAPDDVQRTWNGEEIGKKNLLDLIEVVKKVFGKDGQDTPEMSAFLNKLYEHSYFFFESLWWYYYSPDLQIPSYAREKGLPDSIDPDKPFGKPKGNDIYAEKDAYIRDVIMPKLKSCLQEGRDAAAQ